MRIFTYTALFVLFFSAQAGAQVSYGGQPAKWSNKNSASFPVRFLTMPEIDRAALAAEDAITDQYKETPYRFGAEHEVAIDFFSEAMTETDKYGTEIYRMGIHCPEALTVNLLFDQFNIPEGGKLYLYTADRSEFIGSFDHRTNNTTGILPISLLHSDRIVMEYQKSKVCMEDAVLHISQIVHGYRPILNKWEAETTENDRGPYGNSGACNINVNCPEGDAWQTEKKSVALILSGGNALCSGAMVNNTANDGTPYFLTANHCLGNPTNWVFVFNHETAGCTGNTGPTNQTISGSSLKANNAGSDFALLQLNQTPPANYNVHYAGWDNTDAASVTSAVGIHHPSGDLKKICFENNSPTKTNQGGAAVWYINQWELGATEGGSSGSPLFDQNHRIIGQLYGGFAACSGSVNNGQADWYGRFGISWNGNSAATRLKDWLDPGNTGATIINGFPSAITAVNDASIGNITNVPPSICSASITPSVTITNQGSATLTSGTIIYTMNGVAGTPINWTGNLAQFGSQVVNLPTLTATNGSNTLVITLTNPNGVADENGGNNSTSITFNAVTVPTVNYLMNLTLDDYGTETTWTLKNSATQQTLYSGGPYQDDMDQTLISQTFCLQNGCYTFTLNDSFGDGICCQYGNGGYSVIDNVGVVVGSGSTFTNVSTVNFCVTAIGVEETDLASGLFIYPNPASDYVTIEKTNNDKVAMRVLNALGQEIHTERMAEGPASIRLSIGSWSKGIYFAEFTTYDGKTVRKIVVE